MKTKIITGNTMVTPKALINSQGRPYGVRTWKTSVILTLRVFAAGVETVKKYSSRVNLICIKTGFFDLMEKNTNNKFFCALDTTPYAPPLPGYGVYRQVNLYNTKTLR